MPLKKYDLFVQLQGRWKKVAVIEADDHSTAFRQAMSQLPPEHYDKPIRLEQHTRGGAGPRRK
jgi:hypothetical protein